MNICCRSLTIISALASGRVRITQTPKQKLDEDKPSN
jgi:hypothetical protein